tara:strand:- start:5774 stop:6775 length:1002 start_codon:yes stop_codon:yes gene_type:complete
MINFIHIKYRPKILKNFTILSDIKNKLSSLSDNKYLSNLILYGKNGSCKKTLLLCFLNKYFNNSNVIYNTQCIDFTLSNSYNLFYKVSPKHFEFTFIDNIYINKLIILEVLYPLLNNQSILNEQTIIVIFNIHKIQNNITIIKNITEKYHNVVFLCTSQLFIDKSINFIQLKSNINNYFDLLKLSLVIKKDYKLKISNKEIKEYIKFSNYDINILFNIYQNIINNNSLNHNEDTLKVKKLDLNFINEIKEILLRNDVNDYNKIKNIVNNVLIFKYYSISIIIERLIANILPNIKNKNLFMEDIISLNINKNNNNLNDDIILFDTIILCIYKHL